VIRPTEADHAGDQRRADRHLAACGDVSNVVAANPLLSPVHASVHAQAAALSERLLPNTRAYYEIWLDEEKVAGSGEETEPVYGETYLPRKFKIAFAIPPTNDADVFANDLASSPSSKLTIGLQRQRRRRHVRTTAIETYPRIGDVIGFIAPEQVIALATAVVTAQRDFGNRAVRKRARLKYTIDDRGLDWFKAEVERRAGFALAPARPFAFDHNGDRFGWREGSDGHCHLTLRIPAGRIVDNAEVSHLSGLREIAKIHQGEFRMTPNQNLVIAGVPAGQRERIDALVRERVGCARRCQRPAPERSACVACPPAAAMAGRWRLLDKAKSVGEHDLFDAPITASAVARTIVRGRTSAIALVSKAPGRYNLMLGADHRAARLNACAARASTGRDHRRTGCAVRARMSASPRTSATSSSPPASSTFNAGARHRHREFQTRPTHHRRRSPQAVREPLAGRLTAQERWPGLRSLAGPHALSTSFGGAVGGVAAPAHTGEAGHPGDPGRYGLPVWRPIATPTN
jgi:sulfite reductase beta subunit-like hemoprotein